MKSLCKISSNYHRLLRVFLPVSTLMKRTINHARRVFRTNKLNTTQHQLTIRNRKSAINLCVLGDKGRNGFTLVELIVTIVVLAIIVVIAMPSILTQLTRMEAKRVKTQLENTLALAKAESYITRQDILVCLSNDGKQCDRNSDNMLILFVDKNGNKNFDANADALLLNQSFNLKYSTLKLRVGAGRHYIKFWGDSGKPRGHFGHIKYCPTSLYNESMYQISFNQAGIVRYKPNADHPTDC